MAQTLETVIAINARTGNGFQKVGATLSELGSIVNGLSQELIAFGSDSLNVYRDYQKSMKDAEVALSTTYGRNTRELGNVMSMLDASATEWAATTIFHTNDVANAISEAAHAGWDYEQIMSGIPAAMQLAQAGSLDLSEAVNYIVKSTSAAGIEFEDLTNFTDLWTYAANSSASTIGEFGDAMLRMGSTMRFVANPEELMTLIAVTANAGSTGSEAGTMIRNSMIRLIAPTKKAKDAMAELGATSEETAGLLDDGALAAANARLEAVGFSAYDEKGQLKSVLDTYSDLYVALGQVAGGYENIEKNRDAVEILSAIFPTRTITEAITLLRGASEEWDGLYDAMQNGEAAGYGEYAANTMMNSLDGRIEIFESKVERLKQVVGKELSDDFEKVLEMAGGFIDDIANMDEGQFSAIISALEVVAASGPAILTAAGAFRLIGAVLTPAGGIALGATALIAAVAAVKELEKADFAGLFGEAELDHAAITAHLQEIGQGFDDARKEVDEFRAALDQNVESYKSASSELASKLLTDVLTGATLSDSDIATLTNLGEQMHQSLLDGIENSKAASTSYWEMFFAGGGEQESSAFSDVMDITGGAYDEAVAEAERLGQGIRDAMTAAFADGQISDDEYQNILSYIQSYNDAITRAQTEAKDKQDYIDRQTLLHKAQTASLSEIKGVEKEVREQRNARLEEDQDLYLGYRYGQEYEWNKAIEEGREIGGQLATAERRDAALAELDRIQESRQAGIRRDYDDTIFQLWDTNVQQSALGDAYKMLGEYADSVLSGIVPGDQASREFRSAAGGRTTSQLQNILAHEIDAYGGYKGLEDRISAARESGNISEVERLSRLYAMDQLNSNFASTWLVNQGDGFWDRARNWLFGETSSTAGYDELAQYQRQSFETAVGLQPPEAGQQTTGATVKASIDSSDITASIGDQTVQVPVEADTTQLETQIDESVNEGEHKVQLTPEIGEKPQLSAPYEGGGTFPLTPEISDSGSVEAFLGRDWAIKATPEIDESSMDSLGPYPVKVEPHLEGEDPVTELQSQGVQVDVSGDTQSLTATIDAENGKELLEYVNGDASNLEMSITDQDGRTLTENVHGDISSLRSAIDSQNGRTITVNIRGNRLFASGGRATEASIFGEAGPEWAIPEEHSERTAQLLDAAREASGFTWPDLLARAGGLNADTGTPRTTIVYSPTINAADVTGVEQALVEDKERLDKWFEEKKMMDEVEVYT